MYCGNKIIKIGVCSTVIAFNDGFYGLEKVFHELHFLPGYFFGSGALKSYNQQVIIVPERQAMPQKRPENI